MKTAYIITLSFLLILIMANNIPHGASLYEQIATTQYDYISSYQHGFAVMILFDVCVIVMIFCSDKSVSIALAVLLFFANCFYWNVPESFANANYNSVTDWKLLSWKVLLSGFFSFLLHRISELLQNFIFKKAVKQNAITIQEKAIAISKAQPPPEENAELQKCPKCDFTYTKKQQLSAHSKLHKRK